MIEALVVPKEYHFYSYWYNIVRYTVKNVIIVINLSHLAKYTVEEIITFFDEALSF